MQRVVSMLQHDDEINQIVRFEPSIPQTKMVHGFIKSASEDKCQIALEKTAQQKGGIRVLHRIRNITSGETDRAAWNRGYRVKFE
jgi:hypothetical protein